MSFCENIFVKAAVHIESFCFGKKISHACNYLGINTLVDQGVLAGKVTVVGRVWWIRRGLCVRTWFNMLRREFLCSRPLTIATIRFDFKD